MPTTRDFESLGIWAEQADIDIPPNPSSGTAYRDETVTEATNKLGLAYDIKPDSAVFNQMMFTITSYIDMMDKHGGIGWSDQVDYVLPALAWGTDTNFYLALQASGPSTVGAKDPISEPTYWELVTSATKLREDLENQTPGDEGSRRVGYNKFDINGGIDDGLTVKEALDELERNTNDLHGIKLLMSGSFDGITGLSTSNTFNVYQNKAFIQPDQINPALIHFTVFIDDASLLTQAPLAFVSTNAAQDPSLPVGNFIPTVNGVYIDAFLVPPVPPVPPTLNLHNPAPFRNGVRLWQYVIPDGIAKTTQQDFNILLLTV